jgi:hypothetical protein
MNKAIAKEEIRKLKEFWPHVNYDLNAGLVTVERWPLPDGWNKDTTTILFELPPDFPNSQPAVYIPSHLRFNGKMARIQLASKRRGWNQHCIRQLRHVWNPDRHGMISMLKLIKQSFRRPNTQDPWKGAGFGAARR